MLPDDDDNCVPPFMIIYCMSVFCRSHAIACVNQFIVSRSQALMAHIDSFVEVCHRLDFFLVTDVA